MVQGQRKVCKFQGGGAPTPHEGASSNVVGMIFPLVEIGLRPGFSGSFFDSYVSGSGMS